MAGDIKDKLTKVGEKAVYTEAYNTFQRMSEALDKAKGIKLEVVDGYYSKYDLIDELRKIVKNKTPAGSPDIGAIVTQTSTTASTAQIVDSGVAPPTTSATSSAVTASNSTSGSTEKKEVVTLTALLDPKKTIQEIGKKKEQFEMLEKYIDGLKPEDFEPALPIPYEAPASKLQVYPIPTNAKDTEKLHLDPRRSGRVLKIKVAGDKGDLKSVGLAEWIYNNSLLYGFLPYGTNLDYFYYIGLEAVKKYVSELNDVSAVVSRYLAQKVEGAITTTTATVSSFVIPPPPVEKGVCNEIPKGKVHMWESDDPNIKKLKGVVKKDSLDFLQYITLIVDHIEGTYSHPIMYYDCPGGKFGWVNKKTQECAETNVSGDPGTLQAIKNSGETLFGLDKVAGNFLDPKSDGFWQGRKAAATKFWGAVDKYSGYGKFHATIGDVKRNGQLTPADVAAMKAAKPANAWRYNGPEAKAIPELKSAAVDLMRGEMEWLGRLYYEKTGNGDIWNNVVKKDGRMLFHHVRMTWNGMGFFERGAEYLIAAYKKGERDPYKLICKSMQGVKARGGGEIIIHSLSSIKFFIGLD